MDNPLKRMEYPGRGVIVGVIDKGFFGATFVEGRSPSSQARKYVQIGNIISTVPTDEKTLKTGNPDLLLYNAIAWNLGCVVVSNGKQTDSIMTGTLCSNLGLDECTRQWNYEPDKPIYTPRVHGRIITPMAHAELGIILRGEDDSAVRKEFKVGWGQYRDRGEAHFVSTYLGDRQDVRSFDRDPLTFPVESKDAKSLCEEIGEMLQPDLRVGVAAVIMDKERRFESAILNYRE